MTTTRTTPVLKMISEIKTDQRFRLASCIVIPIILLVLSVASLFLVSTGCTQPQSPRSIRSEYLSAVAIEKTCINTRTGKISGSYGSGVVIAPNMILTAAHVVDPHGMTCLFAGLDSRNRMYALSVGRTDYTADVAQLVSSKPFLYTPISIAEPPSLGAPVCVVTGFPGRYRRCGTMQPSNESTPDLEMDIVVEHGNSGSGMYDSEGHLIGIAVALTNCNNGQICGGAGTSLFNRVSVLP